MRQIDKIQMFIWLVVSVMCQSFKHFFHIKYSIKLKCLSKNVNVLILYCLLVFRGDLACNIALDAVRTVVRDQGDRKEIDIKNYAKVEKVHVLKGFCNDTLALSF